MVIQSPTQVGVIGATAVVDTQTPPEGLFAVQLRYQFTSGYSSQTNLFQLNSQSGLAMSQVVTILIDNTQSYYPISVTHGTMNSITTVPARMAMIVPTFSGKSPYPLSVAVSQPPLIAAPVTIVLMNYEKPVGQWGLSLSLMGNALTATTILATTTGAYTVLGSPSSGSFILYAFDMRFEYMEATAAGSATIAWQLSPLIGGSPSGTLLEGQPAFAASAAGALYAPPPLRFTWPNGLLLAAGAGLVWQIAALTNLTAVSVSFNVQGIKSPL